MIGHVYVWPSPFSVHLKLPTVLLFSYTPIQNVFDVKKKNKTEVK